MARRIPILRLTRLDFVSLSPEAMQDLVVLRSLPAHESRGTVMVRVHDVSVGSGSDGHITVAVRADGFTRDDPAQLFFGQTLASIVAASDGVTAPRYLVETFRIPCDHLMVQIEARQDSTVPLDLSVTLSIDLLLDDAAFNEPWTPAALAPDGWWRGDLGHALADQDPVNAWANQGAAGADGDLGQGTSGLQPTYVESHASFNDQAVLDFDGDNVVYAAAGTWWEQTTDGESLTIVGIARVTTSASAQNAVASISGLILGGFRLTINPGGNGTWYLYDEDDAAHINEVYPGGTQNALHVVAGVYLGAVSPTDDTAEAWLDGALAGSTANDLGPIASSAARELTVGGQNTTAGTYTGQIAELLFIKRLLTADEDAQLAQYLNDRYGLALTRVTR